MTQRTVDQGASRHPLWEDPRAVEMRLLRLVAERRLSPEEALTLWPLLNPEEPAVPSALPQRTLKEAPHPQAQPVPPVWFRALPWGLGGLGLLALVGAGWWWALGPGWLIGVLCVAPLTLLGLLALLLLGATWRGLWLVLHLRQPPGETPRFLWLALPVPVGWLPWAVDVARLWYKEALPLDGTNLRQALHVLRDDPLWLSVHDEDGTQVDIWLGGRHASGVV